MPQRPCCLHAAFGVVWVAACTIANLRTCALKFSVESTSVRTCVVRCDAAVDTRDTGSVSSRCAPLCHFCSCRAAACSSRSQKAVRCLHLDASQARAISLFTPPSSPLSSVHVTLSSVTLLIGWGQPARRCCAAHTTGILCTLALVFFCLRAAALHRVPQRHSCLPVLSKTIETSFWRTHTRVTYPPPLFV